MSPLLRNIFTHMRATPDLSGVAESLGLSVITVLPKNAEEKGIVGSAVRVMTEHDVSIRQIFVTDPYFYESPKLVIIVNDRLPPGVIEEIRALPQVKQVII
jgi:predicted regulator of amino acid metabolism with ACT domain